MILHEKEFLAQTLKLKIVQIGKELSNIYLSKCCLKEQILLVYWKS